MKRKAFTLIELVVVMGIITILFALSVPQLFRLQDRNTLQTTTTKLVSFMRQQQSSAMNSSQTHGIFFEPTQYTLFSGSEYTSTDPANTIVPLDYPVEFSQILFPSSQMIFASGSGEITGFDATYHSVALKDTVHNQEKIIQFNTLGVPVSIQ